MNDYEKIMNDFIEKNYNDFSNKKNSIYRLKDIVLDEEKRLDRDLSQFDEKEIKSIMDKYSSYYTIVRVRNFIKYYKDYTSSLGMENTDIDWNSDTLKVKQYIKGKFNRKSYMTPNEYANKMLKLYLHDDEDSALYLKCYLMCLYEGISGTHNSDLMKLRMSDIDENNIAHLDSGKEIRLSADLVRALDELSHKSQFLIRNHGSKKKRYGELKSYFKDSIFKLDCTGIDERDNDKEKMKLVNLRVKSYIDYYASLYLDEKNILTKAYSKSGMINNSCQELVENGFITSLSSGGHFGSIERHEKALEILRSNGYNGALKEFKPRYMNEINLWLEEYYKNQGIEAIIS